MPESAIRRTKIVATLGPATDDIDVLWEMCRAGLDVDEAVALVRKGMPS